MPLRGQWAGREQVPWTPRPSSPTAAARTGGGGFGASPGGSCRPSVQKEPCPGQHQRACIAAPLPGCWGHGAASDHHWSPRASVPSSLLPEQDQEGLQEGCLGSCVLTADPSTSCRACGTGAQVREVRGPPFPSWLGATAQPPHCLPPLVGTTPISPPTESPALNPGQDLALGPSESSFTGGETGLGWRALHTGLQVTRLFVQRPAQVSACPGTASTRGCGERAGSGVGTRCPGGCEWRWWAFRGTNEPPGLRLGRVAQGRGELGPGCAHQALSHRQPGALAIRPELQRGGAVGAAGP